jgi:hypothetical protein
VRAIVPRGRAEIERESLHLRIVRWLFGDALSKSPSSL